jgi:hypothetical protein
LKALPLQVAQAQAIGLARTLFNDASRKPWEDLGVARNQSCDFFGTLAELLLIEALEREGYNVTDYILLAQRAPKGPDFRIGKRSFNVKAIPLSNRYVTVNEAQRLAPESKADFYVPVAFLTPDMAQVYVPIPAAQVATWPLRQGHSPYRSTPLEALTPLVSFAELRKGGA